MSRKGPLPRDQWLTVRDLTQYLRCSRGALYNLRRDHGFPAGRKLTGAMLRWSLREVEDWLAKREPSVGGARG